MHNLECLLAELSKGLQRSHPDLSELLSDLASYSHSYEKTEDSSDISIEQFDRFQEEIKSISKQVFIRKVEEKALRAFDRGTSGPSYARSRLVFPKGQSTKILLDSHRAFAQQFDEMFGKSWLEFSDNSDVNDIDVSDVDILKMNTELNHLKRWYEKAFLEDRSEFDEFIQHMKRLSEYSN